MFDKFLTGLAAAISAGILAVALFNAPAAAQTVESVYTALDLDKCRHVKGKDVEDYGE